MPNFTLKPYNIVRIGQRPVQLISYPDGEGKIFVRMTPGDPSSAIWKPTAEISRHILSDTKRPVWTHWATVTQEHAKMFPWDMLRYDRFYPEDFRLKILDERFPTGTKLRLYQVSAKPTAIYHPERWLSFGWSFKLDCKIKLEEK